MAATAAMLHFRNAEMLHKTVAEYLTGHSGPVSQMEVWLWNTYRIAQQRLEQQQKPPGKR